MKRYRSAEAMIGSRDGENSLIVLVVPVDKVLHDAARFEELQLLSVGQDVGQGRDAAIGIDFEVPWFLLFRFCNIHKPHFVVESVYGQRGDENKEHQKLDKHTQRTKQ